MSEIGGVVGAAMASLVLFETSDSLCVVNMCGIISYHKIGTMILGIRGKCLIDKSN